MAKRRIRGDRAFGRLLNQLPVQIENDLREQLNKTGRMLLARAQAKAPVYHGRRKGLTPGALRDALSYRVAPKRLTLKVGLVGKPINKRLFYGYLVEYGHRIGYRGKKLERQVSLSSLAAPGSVRYRLLAARRRTNIRLHGVPPHPFLYTVTRQEIYAPYRQMWGRVLRAAAAGASDD